MPDADDYARWSDEIRELLNRIEMAHGDNAAGCYPHPLEMAVKLAWDVALRSKVKAMDRVLP